MCVFIIFTVTLSCYPAVNSAIQSAAFNVHNPSKWASKFHNHSNTTPIFINVKMSYTIHSCVFHASLLFSHLQRVWFDWQDCRRTLADRMLHNPADYVIIDPRFPPHQPEQGSPIMLLLSLLRILIVPIFLLCNVQPRPNHIPVIFLEDWMPILAMAIFAFSNGYLGTLCMMYGPR